MYPFCRGEVVPRKERPSMWSEAPKKVIEGRMRKPTSEEIEEWEEELTTDVPS